MKKLFSSCIGYILALILLLALISYISPAAAEFIKGSLKFASDTLKVFQGKLIPSIYFEQHSFILLILLGILVLSALGSKSKKT
jgi:hypothetical protein